MTVASYEYTPLPPPQNADALPAYVQGELLRISQFVTGLSEQVFVESHSPPPRTQNGQVMFADGVDWNPSNGRGLYQFREGVGWVFIV